MYITEIGFNLLHSMKLTSKAKLTLTILFVTLYMFAAFLWWTYSLVGYGQREKGLQMAIFKTDSIHAAGEASHGIIHGRFSSSEGMAVQYQGKTLYVDTLKLRDYVLTKFPNYYIKFFPGKNLNQSFLVDIRDDVIKKEENKFLRKRASWIAEGVTMGIIMLLISIFMFLYLNRIITVNQQQNNFLLAVTHELKTPIASSKLAIQTAERKLKGGDESVLKLLSMADVNLEKLSKMMDHVLFATRLEAKATFMLDGIIELEDVVTEILNEMKPNFPRTLELHTEFDSGLTITGDRDLMKMAISNLITNAIKYSHAGKEWLEVKTFIENNRIALSVSDHGQGIPENERKRIFRKFYRIGDERTRTASGTGLGLFLVSKILRQHKAIISIENNIPQGTMFKIVFNNKVEPHETV